MLVLRLQMAAKLLKLLQCLILTVNFISYALKPWQLLNLVDAGSLCKKL